MDEPVLMEESGPILVMMLNRPETHNAVNLAVAEALAEAGDRLESSEHLAVGIITGAGGSFSSGMDMRAFVDGEVPVLHDHGFAGITSRVFSKPLIAAVEGYALAGGCEIMLACDLVVAGSSAQFGLPEVRRGLLAAASGLERLPRRIPYRIAMEMALTGDPVTAAEAFRVGLINRVVSDGRALAEACVLAERIAANAPLAVAGSKQILAEAGGEPPARSASSSEELKRSVNSSDDALEGTRAFTEKREPRWQRR